MTVLQSGSVTPGHGAVWVTDNVVGDGGPIPAGQRVLATIRGADFNSIADQPLIIPPAIAAFQINAILVTNASISLTTAVGGFYPAASKAGTPIVAASQVWSGLTSSSIIVSATLASFGANTRFSASNLSNTFGTGLVLWFALTTPQGAAATADIYIRGTDLT